MSLTLPQALLLLTLNDDTGRPKAGFYKPAIAGAAISELLLQDQLELTDEKKPKLVRVSDAHVQSPVLDLVLSEIAASKKPRDMQTWITKLGQHKDLIPTLADELCELGALTKETSKLLGLFTITKWPEASQALETDLKSELSSAINGTSRLDIRSSVIIALAKAADVLKHNFDRETLRSNKARIEAIAKGDLLATSATQAAIRAAQAALTAALVAGAIAPAVTAS